jgi:hypothetical protein
MDKMSGWGDRLSAAVVAARASLLDLTRVTPLRTFGGHGCDALCDYCRRPVRRHDIEYEVDGEIDGEPVTLHLHRWCHDACLGHTLNLD